MPGLDETTHDVDRQHRRQEKGQYLAGEHQPAAIDAVDQRSAEWRDDEERHAGAKGHDAHEPWRVRHDDRQPAERDLLHPLADRGRKRAKPKATEYGMPRDGAEKAAMPGRVNWSLTHRVVELSVCVDAVPDRHDFLQGNACPTNSASARAGNRVDYTTGLWTPFGSARGWSILHTLARRPGACTNLADRGRGPLATWTASAS